MPHTLTKQVVLAAFFVVIHQTNSASIRDDLLVKKHLLSNPI